ncbi:hypothetical protein [Methylocaldum sp. 14B]|uniref:hypothetical protein n=1 Tax=unclassified Methylocaldum TaxID=2622260 RepID=UPI000989BBF3|nr:hypothetical protein [Methylocaldum sp. 14B]
MLNDDGDIVGGLGFVALYSAYLEEQIDSLLFMLNAVEEFTEEEQRWPVSRKIKKAKSVAAKLDFEGRDDLMAVLDNAKNAFEDRNKIVHGRIYGNFDRPDTLKSGRPNIPDQEIASDELYALANYFSDFQGEVLRPMILKIPRALAGNG